MAGDTGSATSHPGLFDGLTPTQAAILITRYTLPGHLILDLTADLAVEGVAGAGARRYARTHPATLPALVDAHRCGQWPTAHLILLRGMDALTTSDRPTSPTPPKDADPQSPARIGGPESTLDGVLRDLAHLLHPDGRLVITAATPGPTEPSDGDIPVLSSLIATAPRARLQLVRRHVITQSSPSYDAAVAGDTDVRAGSDATAMGRPPTTQTELFVLAHRDCDD